MTIRASVLRYIARWGVPVVADGPVTHRAPYSMFGGIHWPTRTIVAMVADSDDWSPWYGCLLVHELSHVLVGVEPDEVDEVGSSMLALDHIGCRLLKLDWSNWMQEYEVDGQHWSLMTKRARADALYESRVVARAVGLLDERGRPTFKAS